MATIDPVRKFAEQSVKVERVLQEAGVTGNAGRIVLVLTMANTVLGVSQKEVVEATGCAKDVVSKLVTSLVSAELLTQERQGTNARVKRLTISDAGRTLLSQIRGSLQPARSVSTEQPKPTYAPMMLFDDVN